MTTSFWVIALALTISACATTDQELPGVEAVVILCEREDCGWIVSDGGIVPGAAGRALELRVHADEAGFGAGASWFVHQDGTRIEVDAFDEEDNAAGSDITLTVPQLAPGPVTVEARRGDATSSFTCTVTGDIAEYGSTYNTSCTCSYCSMWCSTKSGIAYSGSCC